MSRIKAKFVVCKLKCHIKAIKKAGFGTLVMNYVMVKDKAFFTNLAAALKQPIKKTEYYNYSELTFRYAGLEFCYPVREK